MKKHILYLFIISLVFTSCDEDENNTAIQGVTPTAISISLSDNNVTISENAIVGDSQSYVATATLAEPKLLDYVINFEQTAGNADESDYETHNIIIRAGATSGTSNIDILKTGNVEGNESVTIKAVTATPGASLTGDVMFKADIVDDFINDVLETSATWEGSYTYEVEGAEVTVDFCDIDIDILLFTEANGFVQYLGATGACTEVGEISGLPDGKYKIAVDVYENIIAGFNTNQPLPITFKYQQEYGTSGELVINGFTTNAPTGTTFVAELEVVNGYTYTITAL